MIKSFTFGGVNKAVISEGEDILESIRYIKNDEERSLKPLKVYEFM
jgi:hypothetical protein